MKWFVSIIGFLIAFGFYLAFLFMSPGRAPLWTVLFPISFAAGWSVLVTVLIGARDNLRSPEHRAFVELLEQIRDPSRELQERERLLARYIAQNRKVAPKLLDDLFDEDEVIRPAVVRAYGRLRHEEAVPKICRAIDGCDARLGSSIAVALGVFDTRESEAGLVRCLGHSSREVVAAAVGSLHRVGRDQALPALTVLLEQVRERSDPSDQRLAKEIEATLRAVRRRVGRKGRLTLMPRVVGALSEVGRPYIPGALSVPEGGERRADGKRRLKWFGIQDAVFTVGMNARGIFVFGMNVEGVVAVGLNAAGVVAIGGNAFGIVFAAGGNAVAPLTVGWINAFGAVILYAGVNGDWGYSSIVLALCMIVQGVLWVRYLVPQVEAEGTSPAIRLRVMLQSLAIGAVVVLGLTLIINDIIWLDVESLLTSMRIL